LRGDRPIGAHDYVDSRLGCREVACRTIRVRSAFLRATPDISDLRVGHRRPVFPLNGAKLGCESRPRAHGVQGVAGSNPAIPITYEGVVLFPAPRGICAAAKGAHDLIETLLRNSGRPEFDMYTLSEGRCDIHEGIERET
jgi:hypothetical protein